MEDLASDVLGLLDDLGIERADLVGHSLGECEAMEVSGARPDRLRNAPTFLDESNDPDGLTIDLSSLGHFDRPALITTGTAGAPYPRTARSGKEMPR